MGIGGRGGGQIDPATRDAVNKKGGVNTEAKNGVPVVVKVDPKTRLGERRE